MQRRIFTFIGGSKGLWRVKRIAPVKGVDLPTVGWVDLVNEDIRALPAGAQWLLRGVTSYERYTNQREKE